MIDHEHVALGARTVAGEKNALGIGELRFLQGRAPTFKEFVAVDRLPRLYTTALVGAAGDALVMHDHRFRLHVHLQAARTHAEGDVGVFIVRRREMLIESAKFAEQVHWQHDRCAGHVIGFLEIAVGRA
ncbi:hypothetical protein D3C72_1334760 [compost metagenome]